MAVQLTMRENGYIESFNGRLRDECLNTSWFRTLNQCLAFSQTQPFISTDMASVDGLRLREFVDG